MLTKLAAIVLAGSVATLTVAGVSGAIDRGFHHEVFKDHIRVKHHLRHKQALREHMKSVREHAVHAESAPVVEGAAEVAGKYAFDASGNPFGKLPWSAHVELELKPSGRYELRVRTNIDSEPSEEASWGKYRVHDGQVTLYSGGDADSHTFRFAGDRLEFDADWTERLALKAVGVEQTYMKRVDAQTQK